MMFQALFRYIGTLEPPGVCTNDVLARQFLPLSYRLLTSLLPSGLLRKIVVDKVNKSAPGLYPYSICRSRLGDELFVSFLSANPDAQILNLSGGFCTRFERYSDLLRSNTNSRYIELDFPASQKQKLALARNANCRNIPGGAAPLSNMHWLEIDYTAETVDEVLMASGVWDTQRPTLVLWEGVSMYLSSENVEAVLKFVKDRTRPGSVLQMDAVSSELISKKGATGGYGDLETYNQCELKGEPLLCGLPTEEAECVAWFSERGFTLKPSEDAWPADRLEKKMLNNLHRSWTGISIYKVRTTAD